MSEIKLDKKDWKILELLCTDARLSHNQIAKRVGLSKNGVTYRVERLKKNNIIVGFFTILDHGPLGHSFYNLFFRTRASEEEENKFAKFLCSLPNTLTVDRLSGEWNFVTEMGCSNIYEYFKLFGKIMKEFSNIIETYEVHPVYDAYKVEQLPLGNQIEKEYASFIIPDTIIPKNLDKADRQLLYELDHDSTTSLRVLSEKIGLTSETVAERIKRLKKNGIINKFTAKMNLEPLGYTYYCIRLDLRDIGGEKERALRNYIINHPRILYSFMSAAQPSVFIYATFKRPESLENFQRETKERFSDNMVNFRYSILTANYKYNIFPKSFLMSLEEKDNNFK
ncbi:Lrp/AsnC family transcriptional regulator [Candidatus Woesearchaeota archaeon]|jgi:DNA-binding Lrp family transcriptional regulator|nr:Lrp/AsnC family transcriptional regulator [Candidatus Woesearchaeota archaeon]MBT3537953.1 Lrp/AsnC family transcriptional regulator [Candidatus Woesearchaeota archaeon]MBT4698360.1 Lrp/AsnC family transcriptional regulator [Candidatus Woesearchaeota archaeon]MBT4717028.1 Lrp/AsnC family transcriptional regulator [Candidatus Woesearchaeota archaeon]MBT7105622.1 Lrp/AsnC family transcriptional regulator [Candidatus Woesearchaeota archaeon]